MEVQMKNKKFTTVLICCVVALWGIIFYRIYTAMGEQEEPMVQVAEKKVSYFKLVNHLNDKVVLTFDYRDPFSSSNVVMPIETTEALNKVPPNIQVTPKPQVNWQVIAYTGYINNINSKQRLAIMVVNGKEFMLAEGKSLNGVKLLKYAGDSIKVQYQSEAKYIRLK